MYRYDGIGIEAFPKVGRAIYVRQLSKAFLEELHQEERKKGRLFSPGEIRLIFSQDIKQTGELTTKECELVYGWIQSKRPKWAEEHECTRCVPNWKSCDKLQNGKCSDYYTDMEYQHAWDFSILFNCPLFEVGSLASRGKRLMSKLGQMLFLF